MATKQQKQVNESLTVMTELIMPNDTNPLGNLMGGILMRWMDIAGAIAAAKHSESHVVTASVDHVSFQNPIKLGDVITLKAQVTRSWNSSMETYVEVIANDIKGGNIRKSNHAYLTFVAVDDNQKPQSVPKLIPVSSEETKLFEGASRRREIRLIQSGRMKPKDAVDTLQFFEDNK